jgi:hypothetical protein
MKWIEFLKDWSAKHNTPYSQCLKNAECKEAYHKQKGEQKQTEEGNKVFRQKRQTNKLLNFGKETIEIPREMTLDNKVVPTLTASKTIRRRNKQPAINIEPTDQNMINIVSSNKVPEEQFNELKSELKVRRKARNIMKGMKGDPIV